MNILIHTNLQMQAVFQLRTARSQLQTEQHKYRYKDVFSLISTRFPSSLALMAPPVGI